jgi:PKD repeat protein
VSAGFISDTCTGFVGFSSTSVNTPTYYHWDFGDGDSSAISNPVHSYSANGNYTVTLIVCNPSGCDTVIQYVTANIIGPKAATCYPNTQAYCCGRGITHFQLTGSVSDIINQSSNDASAGYEDFSCSDTAMLFTNNPYALTCTTGTTDTEFLRVWLDMNNDGAFDSTSELLYSDIDSIVPVHSGIMTIPALPTNIYGVPIRLRVASDHQTAPGPCDNPQSGQDEDYSVVLNFSTGINKTENDFSFNIYPNPFEQNSSIEYVLDQVSNVSLEVYDIVGKRIESFVNSHIQSSGKHSYQLYEIKRGIYLVKLQVNGITTIKKIACF